jgi:translation initiation factor 4A
MAHQTKPKGNPMDSAPPSRSAQAPKKSIRTLSQTETPKRETPKRETPKSETPKRETPKKEAEKTEEKKDASKDKPEKLVDAEGYVVRSVTSFDDMGLSDELLKGIYAYGFERPSIIQQRAIPAMIAGAQVIGQAQSGTGKTATFSIGAMQRIDYKDKSCQVLVLSNTRELAQQTHNVIKSLGQYLPIDTTECVGGTSIRNSVDIINKGVHLVVGTPGRLYDMISRRVLNLDKLKMCIIDETDEMLSHGFKDQVIDILNRTPRETQFCVFSATMPEDVLELTKKFMTNPTEILVKRDELTLEGIKQFYINIEREDFKFDTLRDLYESATITQAIIYVNEKKKVDWLHDKLTAHDFTISCTHGDMTQEERSKVMEEFRSGRTRVLISTDLLARGIDVQQVSLVINYDLPPKIENYLHRIGRSGRFGRKGVAINFVTYDDRGKMRDIEKYYCTQVNELPTDFDKLL